MRVFLFFITVGAVLFWLGWGIIIFYLDPEQASILNFVSFYVSLFLALVGTIFLFGNALRAKFFKRQLLNSRVSTSFRQAIFFAALIFGWATLQSFGLASWWNVILLILILTVLEFFFVSQRRRGVLSNNSSFYYEGSDPTT